MLFRITLFPNANPENDHAIPCQVVPTLLLLSLNDELSTGLVSGCE
jgi:hypothetical protein